MSGAASEALSRIASNYWEGVLRRNPTLATFFGDARYHDRLPDVGPDGREAERLALRDVQRSLSDVAEEELDVEERISVGMLRLAAEQGLAALPYRLDEMAVDQMSGPQVWLPELLNWHPLDSSEHVDQLIARFRAFPAYMEQYLTNLQDGVRDGRTATRMATERVIGQLRSLLETTPVDSALAAPAAASLHARRDANQAWMMPASQAEQLLAAVERAVYPAYQQMLEFLQGEYLNEHARRDHGVWSVHDGEQIYGLLCRQHTTTALTPAELHQIGLTELEYIQNEMRAIMARLGDASGDVRAFTEGLVKAPDNLSSSRDEIVVSAERLLEAAQAALPKTFGRLPAIPCQVKPIEEYRERDSVAAFYYPPSGDGGRPGIFYVNTYDPASRPKHTLPALTFHEAVPGHHLQIAIATETHGLPDFRRLGSDVTAYVEGWALYTERLAGELGLYPDDKARFGMLGYQAWRACRLVVDTGMHYLHWTRQQGIDFFLENVGLTERETVNEVDRYIIWPGQALSYKIGQREIESLRRETAERLGDRFDLRSFHDELLAHGAVPLSTLRETIERWPG
ncbi:MAG: DUF885 domain-containing protein [Chloroflexi bacterium]|nr:DUF885 domain-containing protein [Chloroflexota bacterium]